MYLTQKYKPEHEDLSVSLCECVSAFFCFESKVGAMIRRPNSGQPIGQPGAGRPQGVFGVFSYYKLVVLFLNMVCMIMALAQNSIFKDKIEKIVHPK
jgi:hypothetical protein